MNFNGSKVDTFANRLKKAMTEKNINQIELSEKTKIYDKFISQSLINKYLKGKAFARQNNIYILSKILDVSESWLMGYDVPVDIKETDKNIKNTSLITYIPVYGKIKAGTPNLAEQDIIGMLPLDMNIIPCKSKDDIFFLQVDGESMNKIAKNGSYVLIKKQNYAENGDIVVALVNGYDATLKKYKRISDTIIMLSPVSTDSSFEDIIVNLEDTEFLILGKKIAKFEIG